MCTGSCLYSTGDKTQKDKQVKFSSPVHYNCTYIFNISVNINIPLLYPQEPMLFGTSVLENIRFGKPEASDAEVISAAKQANAHGFITGFPDGYNTVVGK